MDGPHANGIPRPQLPFPPQQLQVIRCGCGCQDWHRVTVVRFGVNRLRPAEVVIAPVAENLYCRRCNAQLRYLEGQWTTKETDDGGQGEAAVRKDDR
jgi:hypothetical protein